MIKQLFSTLIVNIIDNNKNVYLNTKSAYYAYMISEGSCDSEDWSNGCSKFSFAIME